MAIYIFDLLFILFYLYIKYNIFKLMSCKLRWYLQVKEVFFQIEYGILLVYMYIRPPHSVSEGAVSFWICLFTILCFNFLILKRFKYHNCKNHNHERVTKNNLR